MHNDLDAANQARLDRWRKQADKKAPADVFRKAGPGTFVPRRKDYADIETEEEYRTKFKGKP